MDTQHGRPCSLATALELVGDRWALLAVREVMFGNHRFSEIARNTAAPRDRLAARLKALVAAGILERRQYQSSPPWHDYHLTAAGRELLPVMHALRAWGDKWAVGEPPLRAEHHGHPIHPYVACATCGEPVRPDDLELISTVPDWDITGPKRPAQAPSDEPSATTPHRHSNLDERSPIPGRSESKPAAGS
jgi:DNA-binding HxlR family transcriptional regulator